MNLSIAKEYLLCSMDKKGNIDSYLSLRPQVCFTCSCLLELLYEDVISIKDKKIYIEKDLTEANIYLLPLYEFIKNSKPMKFEKIVEAYHFSTNTKRMKTLFDSVKNSLIEDGCTVTIEKNTVLGNKTYIKSKDEFKDNIVQKIRAEILECGKLDTSTSILVSLLDKSELLKTYFSKYESKCLKERLKEIQNDSNNQIIKQSVDYIDAVFVAIIVSIS